MNDPMGLLLNCARVDPVLMQACREVEAELTRLRGMTRVAPCDWDQESHCTADECMSPATHQLLAGMVDDLPVYELVCCTHARGTT